MPVTVTCFDAHERAGAQPQPERTRPPPSSGGDREDDAQASAGEARSSLRVFVARRRRLPLPDRWRDRRAGPRRRLACAAMPEPPPLSELTTLRLGGPPRAARRRDDRGRARRARARGRRGRRAACSCSPAAATSSSPTRASTGTVVRVATRGVEQLQRSDGRVWLDVAAGEDWDALVGVLRRATGSPASRRCRGSPARSARRRSRTSAPTARRSPTSSSACARWTASTGEIHDARRRGVPVRLPLERLQARPRPLARAAA